MARDFPLADNRHVCHIGMMLYGFVGYEKHRVAGKRVTNVGFWLEAGLPYVIDITFKPHFSPGLLL